MNRERCLNKIYRICKIIEHGNKKYRDIKNLCKLL